ncbi:T9SS type A sorting domain-containing protein [Flavobacteriaceae bacterium SZ-1-7]|uniref:T9SS type A sorting domain-containing protein n=1 Tax=Tamlana sedimenti TaxID=3134126 RepID=UPI003122960A
MKRLLKIGLLFFTNYLFVGFYCMAQNNISSYQYWFDNDYGVNTHTMVSPMENFELNSAISLETITDGLHVFHIRFKDTDDRWSITSSDFFYYNDLITNNINSYQYWFDSDYDSNIHTSVSPTDKLGLNTLIPLETLANGLHSFNIRFRDDKNRWSIPSIDFFYFTELTTNNIDSYQYWFDNDYGNQTTETVSPSGQLMLNTSISLETITDELHLFSIRFKDDKGIWSVPQNQYFYYHELTDSNILAYQYWFDNDIDTNTLVSTTPVQHMQLTEMIPIEDIEEGLHIFSVRFKDDKGSWSVPVNQYFYKSNHVVDNEITGYRYWLNDDINSAIYVTIDNPTKLLNLSEDIDFPGLALGDYTIHFQFKDSSNHWSVVTSDEFALTSLSVIDNTFEKFITAYPNPTKSEVNFDLGESYGLIQVKIFDNLGRLVQQESFRKSQKFKLNINNDADGIYFVIIKADDKKATFKFIKY